MTGSCPLAFDHGDSVCFECGLHCPLHDWAFHVKRTTAAPALVRIWILHIQKTVNNKLASFQKDRKREMTGLDFNILVVLVWNAFVISISSWKRMHIQICFLGLQKRHQWWDRLPCAGHWNLYLGWCGNFSIFWYFVPLQCNPTHCVFYKQI